MGTEVQLREVLVADSAALALLSDQLGYPATHAAMARRIEITKSRSDLQVYVALQDEKIIGWIQAGLVYRLETEPFVEIGGLVVEAAYRGQGIGKKLVERVQQWSVANGQVTLRVRSNTKRREAHQFYRALGFTEAKEQKVFEAGLL